MSSNSCHNNVPVISGEGLKIHVNFAWLRRTEKYY